MVSKNYSFEIRLIRVWNRAWFFFKKNLRRPGNIRSKIWLQPVVFWFFLLKRRRFDLKKKLTQ
jgi:hypothetical protein